MASVAVVGCGYVGGVTAACLAKLGHDVTCIDLDRERIDVYRSGRSPIFEPGLDELVSSGVACGRLRFFDTYPARLQADIVFIGVNTPGAREGATDLRAVRDAVASLIPLMKAGSILVNKSTVPIGTAELIHTLAERAGKDIAVVSNPEFLREGSAIADFMSPNRIILGSKHAFAIDAVAALYERLPGEVVKVDVRTAEMIKYASNAFLATKISFVNEMAAICEALGADVNDVAYGMGLDARIGAQFLAPGLGWGGSCFPKDVRALVHMASVHGSHPQLLRSVMDINYGQRLKTVAKVRAALGGSTEGRVVLVLGAAFKPNTDDIRNSPALELAELLAIDGAHVRVVDPVVPPARIRAEVPQAEVCPDAFFGAAGADAAVLATEWPEYVDLDFESLGRQMAHRVFVDSRNAVDPERLIHAGFQYYCLGRPGKERGSAALRQPDAGLVGLAER